MSTTQNNLAQIISAQGVLNSSVVVEWREGRRVCSEVTRLMNVDQHGATFQLRGRPELGQLVRVMPESYAYTRAGRDDGGAFWALVWAMSEVGAPTPGGGARHVASVLFFGDDVARSFTETDEADYGYMVEEEGVFRLQRMLRPELLEGVEEVENRRRETRIDVPVVVTAEALDEAGAVVGRELAVTENISRRGAALRTTLAVPEQGRVRLICQQTGFTVNSIVRARRMGPDKVGRVHLEFLDGRWPLDGDDGW